MTVLTTQRRALQFTKSGENMKKFTKKILVCALLDSFLYFDFFRLRYVATCNADYGSALHYGKQYSNQLLIQLL